MPGEADEAPQPGGQAPQRPDPPDGPAEAEAEPAGAAAAPAPAASSASAEPADEPKPQELSPAELEKHPILQQCADAHPAAPEAYRAATRTAGPPSARVPLPRPAPTEQRARTGGSGMRMAACPGGCTGRRDTRRAI